jgi:hypothetical protein
MQQARLRTGDRREGQLSTAELRGKLPASIKLMSAVNMLLKDQAFTNIAAVTQTLASCCSDHALKELRTEFWAFVMRKTSVSIGFIQQQLVEVSKLREVESRSSISTQDTALHSPVDSEEAKLGKETVLRPLVKLAAATNGETITRQGLSKLQEGSLALLETGTKEITRSRLKREGLDSREKTLMRDYCESDESNSATLVSSKLFVASYMHSLTRDELDGSTSQPGNLSQNQEAAFRSLTNSEVDDKSAILIDFSFETPLNMLTSSDLSFTSSEGSFGLQCISKDERQGLQLKLPSSSGSLDDEIDRARLPTNRAETFLNKSGLFKPRHLLVQDDSETTVEVLPQEREDLMECCSCSCSCNETQCVVF